MQAGAITDADGICVQVGYFHGYHDGVDYVFIDHPCFHHLGETIYGGELPEGP